MTLARYWIQHIVSSRVFYSTLNFTKLLLLEVWEKVPGAGCLAVSSKSPCTKLLKAFPGAHSLALGGWGVDHKGFWLDNSARRHSHLTLFTRRETCRAADFSLRPLRWGESSTEERARDFAPDDSLGHAKELLWSEDWQLVKSAACHLECQPSKERRAILRLHTITPDWAIVKSVMCK